MDNSMLKRNAHRIVLVAVLIPIIIYNYFGEHVTLCSGYGWDGCVFYRNIVENGIDEYLSDGISYYHTHRMLPFLVTHYLMRLLGTELSPANVMTVSSVINVALLSLSVCCLFGISDKLRWRRSTETVAFACTFYNFHVLKFMGYCPVMTDMATFTLCWTAAYAFITSRTWLLVLAGLISMVTFPLLSLIVLFLVIMPRQKVKPDTDGQWADRWLNAAMRMIYIVWLPVAFGLYAFFRYRIKGVGSFEEVFIIRHPQSIAMAVAGIVAYIVFYWFATRPLKISWMAVLRALSEPRRLAKIAICSLVFVILYKLTTIHGTDGPFSLVNEIALICQYPPTDVLIFIETPFLYLGPVFILIMLFWPHICRTSMGWGTGYLAVLLLSLLFLPDIETRKLICFYVFILTALLSSIDRMGLRMLPAMVVTMLQLAVSLFWIRINVPDIEEYFNSYSVETYMQWPAQRYYMFQGPWQSHEVYMAVIGIEIILTVIFIIYIRRQRKAG